MRPRNFLGWIAGAGMSAISKSRRVSVQAEQELLHYWSESRIRTSDPVVPNDVRYQARYTPTPRAVFGPANGLIGASAMRRKPCSAGRRRIQRPPALRLEGSNDKLEFESNRVEGARRSSGGPAASARHVITSLAQVPLLFSARARSTSVPRSSARTRRIWQRSRRRGDRGGFML